MDHLIWEIFWIA